MLKYTKASDEGSFSPSHLADKEQFKQNSRDQNPETGTKMVMKKRGNKRNTDFPLFPPINQSTTPLNHRRDLKTPYLDHSVRNEIESPFIGGFSRAHGVTTPYVAPSHFSKQDLFSPLQTKDYQHRLSQMSHTNVVELGRIRKETTFANDAYNNFGASSPYIERRNKIDKKIIKKQNEDDSDSDKNLNLQIRSNQIGLLDRHDRFRYRDSRGFRMDEPFSIRKKIEQFRRWHEEQYREKIRKLKVEVDNQYEADHIRITKATLTKHSERNKQGHAIDDENKENQIKVENNELQNEKDENANYKKHKRDENDDRTENRINENKESKNDDMQKEKRHKNDNSSEKAHSEKTWKTWRGINDSYAYTDVKKYMEENELMSDEKETHIRQWIIDVNKALVADPPVVCEEKG